MKFHKDGTLPENGEVFVFGSNLQGIHGAGAAKVARDKFKALPVGHGFVAWKAYALPTKATPRERLPLQQIQKHVGEFIATCKQNPHMEFFVTRVGCGLAGYKDFEIAPLFERAPDNCSFPEPWKNYLQPTRVETENLPTD